MLFLICGGGRQLAFMFFLVLFSLLSRSTGEKCVSLQAYFPIVGF